MGRVIDDGKAMASQLASDTEDYMSRLGMIEYGKSFLKRYESSIAECIRILSLTHTD